MKRGTNANSRSTKDRHTLDEAAAYQIGRTEERLRVFCEDHELPFPEIATRVSVALAIQGDRTDLLLSQMRRKASSDAEVLQSAVEVDRRPRRSVSRSSQGKKRPKMNGPRKKAILRALSAKGASINGVAKKYGITWTTAKKLYVKEAA